MNKVQKKKKELEQFIHKEEQKYCEDLKKEINQFEKVNEIILLNHKRERSNQKEKNHELEYSNKKVEKKEIHINKIIEKIFTISKDNQSFEKCINLLRFAILKISKEKSDKEERLITIIKIFYKILISTFKNNPITIVSNYYDLYKLVDSFLIESEKKSIIYQILKIFGNRFKWEPDLFQDDSFRFNSAEKEITQLFISLPTYSNEEKNILSEFQTNLDKNIIKCSEMLLTALNRQMCFSLYINMSKYAETKMDVYLKQIYPKIMLNYSSNLSQEMKIEFKKIICLLHNRKKNQINISAIDNKIKATPLESYYQVNDAREEKIVVSNIDKWESKQNGIQATKQYYG